MNIRTRFGSAIVASLRGNAVRAALYLAVGEVLVERAERVIETLPERVEDLVDDICLGIETRIRGLGQPGDVIQYDLATSDRMPTREEFLVSRVKARNGARDAVKAWSTRLLQTTPQRDPAADAFVSHREAAEKNERSFAARYESATDMQARWAREDAEQAAHAPDGPGDQG